MPLLHVNGKGLSYVTLSDALKLGNLTVSEVSTQESVPDLLAVNKGDMPVLILDGEELAGAKQNRMLNTSVLLSAHSETSIPVSCTEQGRWSYKSPNFHESGNLQPRELRTHRASHVAQSLRDSGSYRSNQSAVWNGISRLASDLDVRSETEAMADIYAAHSTTLDDFAGAFPLTEGQCGLLIGVDGKVVGFDLVSSVDAYAQVHEKLVRSYVLDELGRPNKKRNTNTLTQAQCQDFIESAKGITYQRFKSVGLGWDYRFSGSTQTGSALCYEESRVHMAFFGAELPEYANRMAGRGRRRQYRGGNE